MMYSSLIVGGNNEFNSVFDDRNRELCFGTLDDMEKKIAFPRRGNVYSQAMIPIIRQIIEKWQVEEEKEPIPKQYDLIEAYCELKEVM